MKTNKIGLGIITCNREDFFLKCHQSVPLDVVDELVTVNDGDPYNNKPESGHFIQHKKNKGVGVSKNDAMQYLLDKDCEHIFLIEDDIVIKDPSVFNKYIETAGKTGVWHLMYGYHGPANKDPHTKSVKPRVVIDYDDCKLALNEHCVGAFCYYHKGLLNHFGLMDEAFKNAIEHIEHSFRMVKAGMLPGYWWWPDVADSYEYLDEQACSEENSSIRWKDAENKIPKDDWQDNIQKGAEYFYKKHGYNFTQVPNFPQTEVVERLKKIKQNYSRPDIINETV